MILASVLLLALASSQGFPFAQGKCNTHFDPDAMNADYMLYALGRASWAVSPFPWYFFSFSTGYYAYKHKLRDTSIAFCILGAYFALIIGFCASLG